MRYWLIAHVLSPETSYHVYGIALVCHVNLETFPHHTINTCSRSPQRTHRRLCPRLGLVEELDMVPQLLKLCVTVHIVCNRGVSPLMVTEGAAVRLLLP